MKKNANKKIVNDELVRYVARLSRLSLTDQQVSLFRGQLSGILDYIEQLNEVDTESTPPTSHVLTSMKNVFREDKVLSSLSNEEALSNAPARKGAFFKVPKVIKD